MFVHCFCKWESEYIDHTFIQQKLRVDSTMIDDRLAIKDIDQIILYISRYMGPTKLYLLFLSKKYILDKKVHVEKGKFAFFPLYLIHMQEFMGCTRLYSICQTIYRKKKKYGIFHYAPSSLVYFS